MLLYAPTRSGVALQQEQTCHQPLGQERQAGEDHQESGKARNAPSPNSLLKFRFGVVIPTIQREPGHPSIE